MLNMRALVNPIKRKYKRYQKIVSLLDIKPADTILDVGSGEGLTFEIFNKVNPITGIDLFPESRIHQKNFRYIHRKEPDGPLPFKDNEFDVVISIGVLEHIHPFESLKKTCDEIQRVGKKYLILVPNHWTIIEPHYSFPFFQLLPMNTQKKLNSAFGLRYADKGEEYIFEEINHYSNKKWKSLFPNSKSTIYWHIGPLITNLIIYSP